MDIDDEVRPIVAEISRLKSHWGGLSGEQAAIVPVLLLLQDLGKQMERQNDLLQTILDELVTPSAGKL
jgi:hypothetical protein